ncbi:unnamed protein product, partial [Larinioides sclopetarius]
CRVTSFNNIINNVHSLETIYRLYFTPKHTPYCTNQSLQFVVCMCVRKISFRNL